MNLEELKWAVHNHVSSGIKATKGHMSYSLEQIEEELIAEASSLIYQYFLKNLIDANHLYTTINCIELDCADLANCPACSESDVKAGKVLHFEIPAMLQISPMDAVINYIGTVDKATQFKVYFNNANYKHHKSRMFANNKRPYVLIDTSLNANKKHDAYVFNANPFMKSVSVRMALKDPRQLDEYSCCSFSDNYFMPIEAELITKVTEKYLRYYRSGTPAQYK